MNQGVGLRAVFQWALICLASGILCSASHRCWGKTYRVEFAPLPHAYSFTANIGDFHYSAPAALDFENWGSAWGEDDPNGSRITNRDAGARVLVSIHIKVIDSRDGFDVDIASSGGLFTDTWVRMDGGKVVEAVFSGAHVPPGSSFWNLVRPGTPRNPYSNFQGYWTDAFIAPPDGDRWEHIQQKRTGGKKAREDIWDNLLLACPNEFRAIDIYAESADQGFIIFASGGNLLIFDTKAEQIHLAVVNSALPVNANRLTIEGESNAPVAVLWRNGARIAEASLAQGNLGQIVGILPKFETLKNRNE